MDVIHIFSRADHAMACHHTMPGVRSTEPLLIVYSGSLSMRVCSGFCTETR